MPLQIVRNDITKMKVDAIVNATNRSLSGDGGVDGSIHRAAGPELDAACRALHGCRIGEAKITEGYRLPCRYVIHTAGPVWEGGQHGEKELLTSCYRSSLALAKEYHCRSVAFPLISSGLYGYPKDQAMAVAVDAIAAFLLENEMTVYMVIFDREAYRISSRLFSDIAAYIDDRYAAEHVSYDRERPPVQRWQRRVQNSGSRPAEDAALPGEYGAALRASTLEEALGQMDESFSEMLLRKIDERGMTDVQCYKKANIDRKLFSKIRSDRGYRPSKSTALAFALALELPRDEMEDLLRKAGYALSRSSKSDIIVEYFVEHGNYNINEINEALFAFGQNQIGG